MAYASGRNARGICDVCGFACRYGEMRDRITNRRRDGLRVCPRCDDKDNPQLQIGRVNTFDPQALYQPRSDSPEMGSQRALAGFNPVVGLSIPTAMGSVTVSVT